MELAGKEVDSNYVLAGGLLLVLFTGLVVQGFSAVTGPLDRAQTSTGSPSTSEYVASDAAGAVEGNRKQVTNIYMDFDVPNVQDAQDATKQLTRDYAGIVESESFNRDTGRRATLTVRIPESNVSSFLADTESRWSLESKNVDTYDVTEQYTELELELKNRRQELDRLESLINRTEDVENLIKIQERMSELRSRIQFLDNQLNRLDRRVEYTTVRINFEEPDPFNTDFELQESINQAYRGVFSSINLMIVGIGYLLPFAALVYIVRLSRRFWEDRRE